MVRSAPPEVWPALAPFVRPISPRDSAALARAQRAIDDLLRRIGQPLPPLRDPRGERQAIIPVTLRLDQRGRVTADTTLTRNGAQLRVIVERMDLVSTTRGW
jgi:hypothetical protein